MVVQHFRRSKTTPATAPSTNQRPVSTKRSTKDGPSRVSSAIVQDVPEEVLQPQTGEPATSPTTADPPVVAHLVLPTRTRKAKELQKRLGVGRPVAVGGSGPRAVTRSATISREKRLRGSQSTKKLEATIQEGSYPFIISRSCELLILPRIGNGRQFTLPASQHIPTPSIHSYTTPRSGRERKINDYNSRLPNSACKHCEIFSHDIIL